MKIIIINILLLLRIIIFYFEFNIIKDIPTEYLLKPFENIG